jgi:hypothetical protein
MEILASWEKKNDLNNQAQSLAKENTNAEK